MHCIPEEVRSGVETQIKNFRLLLMSALGFKARMDSFCIFSHLCDPQIHLWCNTC